MANETSIKDANGTPTTMGVSATTGETRRLKLNDDGTLDVAVGDLYPTGTVAHTADNMVTNASEEILAAASTRKAIMIQVVSGGNARVRLDGGVAATNTGLQVIAGGPPLVMEMPFCGVAAITAIREGTVDSVIAVVQVTA